MVLAAGPRDGLRLQRHHLEVVLQATAAKDGIEPLEQLRVLGGDPSRVLALVPVVIGVGRGLELLVFRFQLRVVVAQGDQRRRPDGHRIRAQGHCLGHVGTRPDPARDDELHLAVHAKVLQRLHRLRDAGQDRHADMFDEHVLRRRRAALHPVQHDDVRARLHRQSGVVIGPRATDLDVDRLFPIGDLAQFVDLDLKIVRPGPVGVTASGTLVDPLGQVAHVRDTVGNLLAQKHPAPARLRALADHHFDGIGAAQVVGVHAIAAGQILINQRPGMAALFLGHATVAGGGRGAGFRSPATQGFLGRAGQRTEAHPSDRHRNVQVDRLLGEPGAKPDIGRAFLAVAFQRVAADRGAEEQQVIEMRQVALGATATDVIDARGGSTTDFGVHCGGEGGRVARRGMGKIAHLCLNMPLRCRC